MPAEFLPSSVGVDTALENLIPCVLAVRNRIKNKQPQTAEEFEDKMIHDFQTLSPLNPSFTSTYDSNSFAGIVLKSEIFGYEYVSQKKGELSKIIHESLDKVDVSKSTAKNIVVKVTEIGLAVFLGM